MCLMREGGFAVTTDLRKFVDCQMRGNEVRRAFERPHKVRLRLRIFVPPH